VDLVFKNNLSFVATKVDFDGSPLFYWGPTQIESPGVYKSGVDIDHPPCGIELARNAIFV